MQAIKRSAEVEAEAVSSIVSAITSAAEIKKADNKRAVSFGEEKLGNGFTIPAMVLENIEKFPVTAVLLNHRGRENAVFAIDLIQELGISDTRLLRAMSERERERGSPVLADVHGYYLPSEDPLLALDEMNSYWRRRSAQARSIFRVLGKMFREMQIDGQLVANDFGGEAV